MKGRGIAVAALLLAVPVAGQLPAPSGSGGQPRIEIRRDAATGRMARYETFDGGEIVLPVDRMSIAELHGRFAGTDYPAGRIDVVSCPVEGDGKVAAYGCLAKGDSWRTPVFSAAMDLKLLDDRPGFPMLKKRDVPVVRHVDYRLRVMPFALPVLDLASGPLVATSEIQGLALGETLDSYPPRALRAGLEGAQTFECQVQRDHSLVCRSVAFDPPQNAAAFGDAGFALFGRTQVAARLRDGQNSVGVRFRARVRWAIPKD